MTRQARLWTGITLVVLVVFNYFIFGYSLAKRRIAIRKNAESILIRQVKAGAVLRESEESYILEILKNEKTVIDKKMRILDAVTISGLIIIVSWTAFGLVVHSKKR